MRRLWSAETVPADLRGGVVALGNFDGFHRGHQAVVGRAVERARAAGVPALVATFDPHPKSFFRPDSAPFALTSLDQRARLLAAAGVDAMLVLAFDPALAAVSPQEFAGGWLRDRLGASGVVTGEDFTFGARRGGTVADLAALGRDAGFVAEAVPAVCDEDGAISSTRIRTALLAGRPEEATRLLTRPFAIEGVVQHGDKVGRTLGYPTANLGFGAYLRPAYGIYAVRGHLPSGTVEGVANLGVRPQFDPPKELLEPHFFDFSGDLYGQTIEVELVSFIRPEGRFDGLPALIAQMHADSAEAHRRLAAAFGVA